ncbi:hypothetical protein [Pseudomonas sp. R32]|uniref:hypothetical protein n=1 Tax=Pseudomonas sp. R32 TaxID=1573704 RepID=UPI001E2FC2FB|nr:hypothetical protein [Pseudomonas sp. R32]
MTDRAITGMETSTAQAIKLAVVSATGLSKDALHIYFGMAVFVVLAAISKQLRPYLAWSCVLALACLGEIVDWRNDVQSLGYWRWQASLHDVLNTLFWPSVLTLLWYLSSRAKHGPDLPEE